MSNLAAFRSVADIDCTGKTVFFRADLNLPMKDGRITDLTRLERTAPGIADLVSRGAKVVVASHLGRPKGKPDPAMSLAPWQQHWPHCLAVMCALLLPPSARKLNRLSPPCRRVMLMLENLRFHEGEEAGDADFAAGLARLADLYVNDAFSVSHRSHASMVGLARLLPACAGPLMATELAALSAALGNPERPVAAVVGGAKVSTKLAVLNNLVRRVDSLIVGGGMANTFLLARGVAIGASLAEADMQEEARAIMATADAAGCTLVLPDDVVLAREFAAGAASRTITLGDDDIAADEMILDTGPATVARAKAAVDTARTIVWNGPMGRSKSRHLMQQRSALRGMLRRGLLMPGSFRLLAAVIRWRRSTRPASKMAFIMSRQQAGHFLNGWKGASCPVLPSCVRLDDAAKWSGF